MNRSRIRILIYYGLAIALGFGVNFLYKLSPNLLFAVLSPVRESVWEHTKLVLWPLLAVGLLYTRREREKRGSWYLAILTAAALILLFGWTVNIRMGLLIPWVNITAFVVITTLAFAEALWIDVPVRLRGVLLMGVGVLIAAVVIFTFWVPAGVLFKDLSLADALYSLPC